MKSPYIRPIIVDYAGLYRLLPFIAQIVVTGRCSGEPVVGAAIKGAAGDNKYCEETRGCYRFLSWQEPPIEITINHHNYEPAVITLSAPEEERHVNLTELCT